MDVTTLTQLIGSLGFPIIACVFLYKQNVNIENQHREEMTKMVEALNNNTNAIIKLSDKIEVEKYGEIKADS